MKNYSIWKDNISKDKYNKVCANIDVDILIIGGGMTGLSAAYHLKGSNLKICLVEKNEIGMGVSANTTGKLTFLQDIIYSKLNKNYSFDISKKYYESQKDAIDLVNDIVKKNNIECNFTMQKSYLFAVGDNEIDEINEEKEILLKFGEDIIENGNLPIHNLYSFGVSNTYYFHPVKYIIELAKICKNDGVEIYEHSNITELIKTSCGYKCSCNGSIIKAKKVILACHYPFFIKPYIFPLKANIEKSYISASEVKESNDISGINIKKQIQSFRYHQNNSKKYFIYLNGTHNLGNYYDYEKKFNNLINNTRTINRTPNYIWSNTDIKTNDNLPYIGYIDTNLLICTGYNTWGMTNANLAGKILADLILTGKSKYKELFDPKRVEISTNLINISKNIFSSAKPLIDTKVNKNKSFYSSRVIFGKRNGKDIAVYIDENNREHIVYNKCPHLKCSLIFNEKEKTWDCPCHSSRFDLNGKCIQGPSAYDITYRDQ